MKKKNTVKVLFALCLTIALFSCKTTKTSTSTTTTNDTEALKKPYVILISLDGFRWDYVERFQPPHLSKFIKNGVKATSLIPSFPTKTFPNHYTLATGMYPDKHGLVGNTFYSHKKDVVYNIRTREIVEDGTFYQGTPIWVLADNNHMVSASYFFVGSEADVQGKRPTYYHRYDGAVKNEERVKEAIHWLGLPEEKRPHIITMYFSDMDDTGHQLGPNDDEALKKTLFQLDKDLGDLFEGVKATGLPVNIIVVSDHGMANVTKGHFLSTDALRNEEQYKIIDNGALLNVFPKDPALTNTILAALQEKENHFKVYLTPETPGFEYNPKNKDWGAIQIIPDEGYYFSSDKGIAHRNNAPNNSFGVHGYTPENKDMHGIFYANGPAFKTAYTTNAVKNIHVYPLICKILGLTPPSDIDGQLTPIQDVLQ